MLNRTIRPSDMKALEADFMQRTGMPGALLMEHAAQGVVKALERHAPRRGTVLFFCGPGNNGGDGYAAARLWQSGGGKSLIVELSDRARRDAGLNRHLAIAEGVPCVSAADFRQMLPADAAVDALFGTGLDRAPEGEAARLISMLNASGLPVVSVDIPSGLDGTTGLMTGEAVRATETVTFHRIKDGLLLRDAPNWTGRLTVHPILIPPYFGETGGLLCPSAEDIETLISPRSATAHKGTMGRVVIFAGSYGMAGAAAMAARACLKAGAGLVELLCRPSVLPLLQQLVPAAVCRVLPEEDGQLTAEAAEVTEQALRHANTAVMGCGLGTGEDLLPVLSVLAEASCPVVWDADALNMLALHGDMLMPGDQAVLTPHPGEAARLLGWHTTQVIREPLEALRHLQRKFGCRVVLKGARTLMADERDEAVCRYGSPALARGGSGDMLSGILGAMLARPARTDADSSLDPVMAAVLLHALMGERAAAIYGADAVTVDELIECYPDIKKLRETP